MQHLQEHLARINSAPSAAAVISAHGLGRYGLKPASEVAPRARRERTPMFLSADRRTFFVNNGYPVRDELRAAGFVFNKAFSRWETQDREVAAKVVRLSEGQARQALIRDWRALHAGSVIARAAASRIRSGDVERARTALTPPAAAALREAFRMLAGLDDDRAATINNRGFSKADSELGHALEIRGIKSWVEAALALKVAWKYRKQLGGLHSRIFENLAQPA